MFMFRRASHPGFAVFALIAALILAIPATALAKGDDGGDDGGDGSVKSNDLAGWEYDNAPAATHIALYTQFIGTKDQFLGGPDQSTILGVLTAIGEGSLIPEFSIFGEISYRYLASGSNQMTGWQDPIVGAKVVPIHDDNFAFAALIKGNLPIGEEIVSIRDYEATSLGLAVTFAPMDLIGFNLSADFGRVWKLELNNADTVKAIEFTFKFEVVVTPPAFFTARIGITGVYRDQAVDKAMFQLYADVNALKLFFLRIAIPLDIDAGVEGIQQGFETGQILVTFGLWFPV